MQKKFLNYIIFQSNILLPLFFFSNVHACLTCPVSTGTQRLNIKDIEIIIDSNVSQQCIKDSNEGKDVICFPHSTMTIKRQGQTQDVTDIIERWDEFHIYFVKIRENKYFADLNNDGHPEIALLPQLSGGGAIVLTAHLYTLTNNGLNPFGQGRFFWENGKHVLLGCPDCWKFNLEKCNTCY